MHLYLILVFMKDLQSRLSQTLCVFMHIVSIFHANLVMPNNRDKRVQLRNFCLLFSKYLKTYKIL